jgi:putative ABC transport system permease protein
VLRFIWGQLRGRPRRTLAMLAGVLVATTGFTVLSAGAVVQRLRVEGAVQENYRPAYDILVRPKGSQTTLEKERGLVAPNYLSGLYGGITLDQVEQVRDVANVEVAAPIAMLGYVFVAIQETIDLTDQVDPTAQRQVFRLTPSWIADRGLTVLDDAPHYVYLTRNEIISGSTWNGEYADGSKTSNPLPGCGTSLEVEPDGRRRQICEFPFPKSTDDGTTALERTALTVWRLAPDGRFVHAQPYEPPVVSDRLTVTVIWRVAMLAAAVDPAAEAALVGLDKAVVSGRYLDQTETPEMVPAPQPVNGQAIFPHRGVASVVANTSYLDEQVTVAVERLGSEAAAVVPGRTWPDWVPRLDATSGTSAGPPRQLSTAPRLGAELSAPTNLLYQPGAVRYRVDESGALRPEVVPPDPRFWEFEGSSIGGADQPPRYAIEDGFRPLTQAGGIGGVPPHFHRVGVFEPAELRGFSPLSGVPMETYQAPEASGADAESRELLGERPLLPNSNPAGYLTAPPLVLTNLASIGYVKPVQYERDPISAIRVLRSGYALPG